LRVVSCREAPLKYTWIEKYPECDTCFVITQQFEYVPRRRLWILREMTKTSDLKQKTGTVFFNESLAAKEEAEEREIKLYHNYSSSSRPSILTSKKKSPFRHCKRY